MHDDSIIITVMMSSFTADCVLWRAVDHISVQTTSMFWSS